jgi:hypothetical protein
LDSEGRAVRTRVIALLGTVLAFSACSTVPLGPTAMVLPGAGKSFEQFQADDAVCRPWAAQQAGTTPRRVAEASTVEGAALGTLLGAGLGAALGAAAGHPARDQPGGLRRAPASPTCAVGTRLLVLLRKRQRVLPVRLVLSGRLDAGPPGAAVRAVISPRGVDDSWALT